MLTQQQQKILYIFAFLPSQFSFNIALVDDKKYDATYFKEMKKKKKKFHNQKKKKLISFTTACKCIFIRFTIKLRNIKKQYEQKKTFKKYN